MVAADVVHRYIALVFVFIYPLGIPLGVGWQLFRQRDAISNGRGPSEFEMLYKDFKPDCCMWEIYSMLEKATLVGLLGFLFPGAFDRARARSPSSLAFIAHVACLPDCLPDCLPGMVGLLHLCVTIEQVRLSRHR